jgi:hypothetical protein
MPKNCFGPRRIFTTRPRHFAPDTHQLCTRSQAAIFSPQRLPTPKAGPRMCTRPRRAVDVVARHERTRMTVPAAMVRPPSRRVKRPRALHSPKASTHTRRWHVTCQRRRVTLLHVHGAGQVTGTPTAPHRLHHPCHSPQTHPLPTRAPVRFSHPPPPCHTPLGLGPAVDHHSERRCCGRRHAAYAYGDGASRIRGHRMRGHHAPRYRRPGPSCSLHWRGGGLWCACSLGPGNIGPPLTGTSGSLWSKEDRGGWAGPAPRPWCGGGWRAASS